MKKLFVFLVAALMMVMLVGCDWLPSLPSPEPDPIVEPVEILSADVEIINWVQGEEEVEVTYEITNTGTVDIAYYKILFKVTYADGVYIIWHEKVGIAFAGSEIVEVIIEVSDEVVRIDIEDLKLTEWKW